MSEAVRQRLANMGFELSTPATPAANYVGVVQSGAVLYVSGQLPVKDGVLIKGVLGESVSLEQAQEAAQYCALAVLSQVNAFLGGDLGRVKRCIKLGGFIASAPHFFDQHLVMNGASDMIVAALGEAVGKHARFAVGVAALPLGAAVEVDALFEVES